MNRPDIEVAEGYLDILEEIGVSASVTQSGLYLDLPHIVWMLYQIVYTEMSETKANRWLGYAQCALCIHGIIDVKSERNRTRNIFNGK